MKNLNLRFSNLFNLLLYALLITSTFSLDVTAQCNDGDNFDIDQFTNLRSTTVFTENEISGLTLEPNTSILYMVTDDNAKLIKSNNGQTTIYDIPPVNCRDDFEAVTFLTSVSGSIKRLAIAEERRRVIYILEENLNTENITIVSEIHLQNITVSCGNIDNRGIEGLAYDNQTNTIYFGLENERIIRKFTLPTNNGFHQISSADISAVVDLNAISELSSCTLSGMDVLPNGNLVALVTDGTCTGDSGVFPRNLVELDPCGNFISEFDLQEIADPDFSTVELEGVAVSDTRIYLVGEELELYELERVLPSAVTVDSPGLGDVFSIGDQFTVTWSSQNLNGNVKIELLKGSTVVSVLNANTANDGSYTTNIPVLSNNTGSNFKIRITSLASPDIADTGDNFTIQEGPSINVINPGDGDIFAPGDGITVQWSSNNVNGNVKIELLQEDNLVSTLIATTANDNQQNVTLPTTGVPNGNDYRIKITSLQTASVFDVGDYFTIQLTPSITISEPTATDIYTAGGDFFVTWSTSNLTGNVKIELYKNNQFHSILNPSHPTSGFDDIILDSDLEEGTDYQVKVTSLVYPDVCDFSDYFTILLSREIFITSPNNNDLFYTGQVIDIEWNSLNITGNVSIDLLLNNNLVTQISASTPYNGSATFAIPTNFVQSDFYNIIITSLDHPSVSDMQSFPVLTAPTIEVTNPSQGDIYNPTQSISVQWTYINSNSDVQIDLYQGGVFVATIEASTPNDEQQSITLPSPLPDGNDYQISVMSLSDPTLADLSGFFTISNSCPEDLVISNTAIANSNQEAENTISSDQIVGSTASAAYHAGVEVLFTDGFVASAGSTFRAYIEGCTGNFQTLSEETNSSQNGSSQE